jgi:hypothetical protein
LKVEGVKLRGFEDQGGISKWLVVQGGLVKFPLNFIIWISIHELCFDTTLNYYLLKNLTCKKL